MDLSRYSFTLYDSLLDDGHINTLIIAIDPNTGDTTIPSRSPDGNSDYLPMRNDGIDILQENSNNYRNAYKMLMDYLKDYNPQVMAGAKGEFRINHLKKVIGYYYEWFKVNDHELPLPEISITAQDNRSVDVDGVMVPLNKRQYNVLLVLKSSREPIRTRDLLYEVDKLCNTLTEYTRISEIFKGKSNVFHAYIESPRKGFYRLKNNF